MIQRPHLAVTLGDPCGIGPELLLRILGEISAQAEVTIFGTRAGLQLLEGSTFPGSPAPWTWTQGDNNAWQLRTHPGQGLATWIDPVPDLVPGDLTLGQGSAASGRAAALAVEAGARFVMAGHADALLTLPLSKAAVHAAGYAVPGHTEFLQQLAGVGAGVAERVAGLPRGAGLPQQLGGAARHGQAAVERHPLGGDHADRVELAQNCAGRNLIGRHAQLGRKRERDIGPPIARGGHNA